MAKSMQTSSKLKNIVQAAIHSPLYRWRFENIDCIPKHFESFPITTKAQLYHGYENYIFDQNAPQEYRQSIYLSPSGSSGEFFNVTDHKENELQRDMLSSFISKYNALNASFIFGNLFAGTCLYRALDVSSSLIERCEGTSIALERGCSNDLVYKYLKRFCANGIAGMPPRLMYLMEYLNENNITDLYLPNVLYAGENLTPTKLNILQDTIQCNNVISLYGSAECGVWAVQNEKVFDDKYFYFDPNMIYVEVDDKTNEFIVTSLVKHRYPLIKYNTNDIGRIVEINDKYGVIELYGRGALSFSIGADCYDLQEGDGAVLTEFLNAFVEFQIIIDTDANGLDHLLFLLVTDKNKVNVMNELECEKILKPCFYGYGGKAIEIKCKLCDFSELRASKTSGKIKKIIDLRV
eukprot:576197_1